MSVPSRSLSALGAVDGVHARRPFAPGDCLALVTGEAAVSGKAEAIKGEAGSAVGPAIDRSNGRFCSRAVIRADRDRVDRIGRALCGTRKSPPSAQRRHLHHPCAGPGAGAIAAAQPSFVEPSIPTRATVPHDSQTANIRRLVNEAMSSPTRER
jgi:hypothetical protein